MKKGDFVLFYHSVTGKEIVGIAKVTRTAYPDATAEEAGWDCVDLVPVRALPKAVTLAQVKADAALKDIALLRQSRLSVMPLSPAEYAYLLRLGGGR